MSNIGSNTSKTVAMIADQTSKPSSLQNVTGRLVLQYLQENQDGATTEEILQHLQAAQTEPKPAEEFGKDVVSMLENATALGFLERKGSKFQCWSARAGCCRRRKRRSCSRRRRRNRGCSRRRRRTRGCSRRRRRRKPKSCACRKR